MNVNMYQGGEYLANNPSWHLEDSGWKAGKILELLQKNRVKFNSICEVGCGAGGILESLHNLLDETVKFNGYEISPQAYDVCKSRATERLAFHKIDNLAEIDALFDVGMAIDVLEHVEDCHTFLRELKKRAEFKVLHIPLDLSVQTVLRMTPILAARERLGHIHYFSEETALCLLKENGYEILDYFFTAGANELPNRPLKSKLARVPREILYNINSRWAVRLLGGYSLLVLAR